MIRRFTPSLLALCLLPLLVAPTTAWEIPESDTLEPWHLSVMRQVAEARISPDGETIAYTLAVPRRPMVDESGSAWRELYLLRDGESVPFVTGEVSVSQIDWTPDGEISFLAKRGEDENTALWVIPTDGGEARKILEHETSISDYSWSADATRVAFLATEEKSEVRQEREEHGFDPIIYEEDSLFTRAWIATLEGDGSEEEPRQLDIEGSVRAVRFSPGGGQVMATVTPTPLIDDSYVRIKVHVVDAETGSTSKIIDNPGKLGDVRYSPDGRYLAMISAADLNDPAAGRLMVAGVGVGQLRDLLPDLEGHVSSFRWRDDDTLVYVADLGTLREVGTVDLDGSRTVLVPASTPILSLQDLAEDGSAVFTGDSPQHPSELYSLAPGSSEPRRLTSSNDWLDDVRLARQEVVEFEARDGLRLEGVLIYPRDYREGERYPLILTVHGGPESHHNNGWMTSYSRFGQIAAARGFAVFYTNYRGSTGRGVEFSKISQADAAGAEFDDLVDAVDHLIEIGLVDRDRVGIMGGSYGGYASAWGTTYYSDRFAAASPFVGISDNISKVGTTDIPREMYDVHHLKWLWEDWDYFAERSPIYYVKRNRTPTLILHGAEDPRVHPSQSLELYRHLKVLGQAPVRLVLYPGEGHGNRKSAARLDYTLRVLRWMEHYLQGPGGEPPPYEIDYAESLPWVENEDESTEGSGDDSTGS